MKNSDKACAALHLANDDINHCHLIAQDHEGDPTADLLHATLHRREGETFETFPAGNAHELIINIHKVITGTPNSTSLA